MLSAQSPAVLLPAAILAAGLLGGCGGTYYQTRYIPTNLEDARSMRLSGNDDPLLYDLPANPPAIEDHRTRECARPGEGFPVSGIVAYERETRYVSVIEAFEAGAYDRRPVEVGPLQPLAGYAVYGSQEPFTRGIKEPLGLDDVGTWERRPRQRTGGAATNPPILTGAYRRDEVHYCNPEANLR